MEPIIKSFKRYKLIKYPEGMLLNDYDIAPRESDDTGVVTEKFGGNWFVTPKGRVIFKNYDVDDGRLRIVNELLYDELAKQIGLPVAKYLPAEYKSYPIHYLLRIDKDKIEKPEPEKIHIGLASVSVLKKDERLFNGGRLLDYDGFFGEETLKDYIKALEIFEKSEGYSVDKKGIKSQLYKMMVLDALTFNEDRHLGNVFFIRNDKEKYLKASPVIDSELCFLGVNIWIKKSECLENAKTVNEVLAEHGQKIRMFVNNDIKNEEPKNRYKANVKALVDLSANSNNMQKFLNYTLKRIDINKAFKNVEKMGYEVTPDYKEYVNNLINISTGLLKKYMKELNKVDESAKEKTL
ncbi:MAG: hypothetical protein IKR12_01740 [Clostridia bacterium]|nr:hypothetical protein [Clostridia bacterium]